MSRQLMLPVLCCFLVFNWFGLASSESNMLNYQLQMIRKDNGNVIIGKCRYHADILESDFIFKSSIPNESVHYEKEFFYENAKISCVKLIFYENDSKPANVSVVDGDANGEKNKIKLHFDSQPGHEIRYHAYVFGHRNRT